MVLLVIDRVPVLAMPPPRPLLVDEVPAEFPEIAQAVRVSVPELLMPPPSVPPKRNPLAIVRPDMVTVPDVMLKIRKFGVKFALLRRTVRTFAPGPVMITFLLITNSALVRSIVVRPEAKSIVSPGDAVRIAWRSVQVVPAHVPPESALLFTVIGGL